MVEGISSGVFLGLLFNGYAPVFRASASPGLRLPARVSWVIELRSFNPAPGDVFCVPRHMPAPQSMQTPERYECRRIRSSSPSPLRGGRSDRDSVKGLFAPGRLVAHPGAGEGRHVVVQIDRCFQQTCREGST